MAKFQCNFISYVLQRTVDITVVVPSATIPEALMDKNVSQKIDEKYPVLYLLHGYGNNHATWTGYSNVELFAEERQIAVVMISGENKFYRTVANGDDFERFIDVELPEFITNMFPVSNEREHTYIAGLSMGGAGALLHGLKHPEMFKAIGAFSAAIGKEGNTQGLPDFRDLIEENIQNKIEMPALYIACGEDDFLYQDDKEFMEFCTEKGLETTWVSVPGYTHEWRFWNMQVEAFLDYIPRSDGYAKKGKRTV